ncbi:MAG: hypothetical protein CMH27_08245 [Micavibrio sp.]|nr:hypothetical protein [Micavibrio sp.]
MPYFKLPLIFTLALALACVFSLSAQAQPKVQAAPPAQVSAIKLSPPDPKGLVVVELFSSQACLFCPKADAYLNILAEKDHVIALACHVDYFDIKEGSLAHSFCTQRQNQYSRTLRSGPKYTPQMIMNGRYDAIGHKKEKVDAALFQAASQDIREISISPASNNQFSLVMPDVETGQYSIWVAITSAPVSRSILIGNNRGQSVLYKHIVDDLKSPMIWSGDARSFKLSADLSKNKEGVAVWAQNQVTGEIVAAGQYKLPGQ